MIHPHSFAASSNIHLYSVKHVPTTISHVPDAQMRTHGQHSGRHNIGEGAAGAPGAGEEAEDTHRAQCGLEGRHRAGCPAPPTATATLSRMMFAARARGPVTRWERWARARNGHGFKATNAAAAVGSRGVNSIGMPGGRVGA